MKMTKNRRENRNKTIRRMAQEHPQWSYDLLGKLMGLSAMTIYRVLNEEKPTETVE